MKKFNFRLFGLFAFIVLSWGLGWPINKIGLAYMSPLWYTATRMVVGTATMMALVIVMKKFALPRREDFPLIGIVGLLQISIYMLLCNLGLAYLPAGRSSLIAYTTPLWVMPIATLFFDEEAGWLRWIGFSLGFCGLILLLSPWGFDWSNTDTLIGTAMLLLASLSWSISIMCARYMHWSKSPLELVPWQLLVGTLPVLAFAMYHEPVITVQWNIELVLSLIYTGILVTGLSYWSGVVINRELPTSVVSLGFLAVPVFSLIISSIYMHETISASTASAMTLILLGLMCLVL